MIESKKWYESKGVWGAILTVATAVASMIGYQITPVEQQAILGNITGLVTAAAGITAWIGRISATKKIG